jgi:Flp pilus assembly protein TadG
MAVKSGGYTVLPYSRTNHSLREPHVHRCETIMKTMLRSFLHETKGIAAIEVAFILPFMFLLYFGLYDLTSAISVNRKVTYAASVVADLVAQNKTSVLKSDIQNYYNASNMVLAPISSSTVRVEVFGYRKTGSTIAQFWKTDNASGSSCGAAPSTGAMTPLMVAGNDLVVARVCTTYTPFASTFLGHEIMGEGTMDVGETIIQRPRSTLQLTCYNTTVGGAVCS